MSIIVLIWTTLPLVGRSLNETNKQYITLFLAVLTISIELFDDGFRYINDNWNYINNLPLHLCSFATLLSSYALYTRSQSAFELTLYWGIGGAFQAIITPEFSKLISPYYFYISQMSHAMIVLNVLWMLLVLKMKVSENALKRAIPFTIGLMVIVGIINYLIGSNYFFLQEKPDVANPMLIGEWPIYIGFLILFGSIIIWIIDMGVKRVQAYID